MALPTFVSLKLALENYIDNPFLGRSVAPHTQEILEFVNQQVESSEKIARKLLLSSTSRLDLEIRVAVSKLLYKMYALKSTDQTSRTVEFPTDQLEDLKRATLSFAQMMKNMEAAATEEVLMADDSVDSSRIDETKMVGLSDQYKELKDELIRPTPQIVPKVLVIVGMAGIGKTTLANKMFDDPDVVTHYDCRLWVTVGRKCKIEEIPRRILAALDDRILAGEDDQVIAQQLREKMMYGIDTWPVTSDLISMTTRLEQQEEYDGHFPDHVLKMRLLDKDESWDLLRDKIFGDQSCPSQLEKEGKKIAVKCEGLPLMIVVVADLLSKEVKTPEFWRAVAAKKNHKIFMDAYQEISKVLYSSYEELTEELRMCFLYMGVFPQELKIPLSKLMNMWGVDGFLESPQAFQNPSALECLDELVSNSVVMIYQSSIGLDERVVGRHQIKTCGLHSSFWHLSRKEGTKTKFCHVLSVYDDLSYIEGQSRLSFHNNVLFGIEDVCGIVEDECASSVRSLLCYGPYHQYQVPLCFGLKLLQELDAVTVRFYEFPTEVLQLVELKYLALTFNGEIPSSISKLSKLEYLIVGRHMSIETSRTSSYLPVEIWDMKELKHVQVMRSELPDPYKSLENLSSLLNVRGQSCNEGVFKATPNLKKLGIRVELFPNDGGKYLGCLDHVHHLEKLESLKYVILNPESGTKVQLSVFPQNLRKLSLSGLGCSWSEMSKIALLRWLEVLKLRDYAFQGPKWEVIEEFSSLKSLVIEDCDLEEWIIGRTSLASLKSLRMKHCYKLRMISWVSDWPLIPCHKAFHNALEQIEMEDCNPSGVDDMNKALPRLLKDAIVIYSSCKDKKIKT